MGLKWSPYKSASGEIHESRCHRFTVIQGSDHFTLLDHGVAVYRHPREDYVKQYAKELFDGIPHAERVG